MTLSDWKKKYDTGAAVTGVRARVKESSTSTKSKEPDAKKKTFWYTAENTPSFDPITAGEDQQKNFATKKKTVTTGGGRDGSTSTKQITVPTTVARLNKMATGAIENTTAGMLNAAGTAVSGLSKLNNGENKTVANAGKKLTAAADTAQADSGEQIQGAKEGLGKVGKFLVDTGVAGTQMIADAGVAGITGGSALVPMFVRSFGGGAQEARQAGGSFGQQIAYGVGSGAIEVGTEKISNVAAPFKSMFGKGFLDSAIEKATAKMAKTEVGKALLTAGASAVGEGFEEFVGDALYPLLKGLTYQRHNAKAGAEPDYGVGNIDLNSRPVVKNEDGSFSTVDSFSNWDDQIQKEVLVPTVIQVNGEWKHVSEDEAWKHYLETGEYLGKFDKWEDADAYAEQLHNNQSKQYSDSLIGSIKNSYGENFDLSNAIYDSLVGGALGLVGASGQVVNGVQEGVQQSRENQASAANDQAYATMQKTGMFSPESRTAVQDAQSRFEKAGYTSRTPILDSAKNAKAQQAADLLIMKPSEYAQKYLASSDNGSQTRTGEMTQADNYRTHKIANVDLTQPEVRVTSRDPAPSSSASGLINNIAQSSENGNPGQSADQPIQVGRATTIYHPYHGDTPVQAQKDTTAVEIPRSNLSAAQNSISGTEQLTKMIGGTGFKKRLENLYKQRFKATKNVPVDGVSFDGTQYTVDINNGVPGKVISDPHLSAEKLAVLDTLPQVVQNGTYVGSGDYVQHGTKAKPVLRYDYFESPISIAGKDYVVQFDVESIPGANNYRTHKLTNVDLIQPEARLAGKAPVPSSSVSSPISSIAQSSENNNTNSGSQSVGAEETSADQIFDMLTNVRKRVPQSSLTNEQFNEAAVLQEQGKVGMDAHGNVFAQDPATHIDNRTVESVGDRSVNAFQFDNPGMHSYYKQAAQDLLNDAQASLDTPETVRTERTMQGKRTIREISESPSLRSAMDTGLSRGDIINAAEALVNDHGQENYAAAKRLELVLDDMLTNGYTTMYGKTVEPNTGYLSEKAEIAGSNPQTGTVHDSTFDGLGAANAGFDPYSRLQNQTDASNFHDDGANAARVVDVPKINFEGRNVPESAKTTMGAQATDDATVVQIEKDVASGKLAFDTITDEKSVGRAQNTIQEKGFDGALEQYRNAANIGIASKDNTALGQQLILQSMRERNSANLAELLSLYMRNSTTVAQAHQAESMFRKLSPEGQLIAVQRAVSDLGGKYGIDLEIPQEDLDGFLNAGDEAGRGQALGKVYDDVSQQLPSTFQSKFDTFRYLAMLGNPKTHIRNILGNTLFQGLVFAKNRVGAVEEAIANKAGANLERTKSIIPANPLGKLGREAFADWVNAKDFLTRTNKYNDSAVGQIEERQKAFTKGFGKVIQNVADANTSLLELEDNAAKRWIYSNSLAGYLKANGVKSFSDIDSGLLFRARNYAAQEALKGTFNDTNALSSAVVKLNRLRSSQNPVERGAGYVTEGMLPFKKTPANIVMRSVEYSPAGFLEGAKQIHDGVKSGESTKVTEGLDHIASGMAGTAVASLGWLLAASGVLAGRDDQDKKQQNENKLLGRQDYALEIGGKSITLDWVAPESIPFFMGAQLAIYTQNSGISMDDANKLAVGMTDPILEMTMLQGLNDTIENAAYAKNTGESVTGSIVTSALTNYLTQVFPTLGGQIERSTEPVRMTTYTDKNSPIPSDAQYTLGKISAKVPGWDYNQIPYIDAWGRTQNEGSAAERVFNNFLNPSYVSDVDIRPVEQELQRVADKTGSTSVFPQGAERSFTADGEDVNLTAQQYQTYAKLLGTTRYSLLKEATHASYYKAMTDGEKADYISDLYEYSKATSKMRVSNYAPDSKWILNAQSAKKDLGVSTAEYIALKEKYGSDYLSGAGYEKTKQAIAAGMTVDEFETMQQKIDTNKNGNTSQAEAKAYLDKQDYPLDEKAKLWNIIHSTWKNNPYK